MTYLQNQTNNISSSPNRSWVSPVIMNKCTINEDSWLKCLLGLKYTPDLKWKLYICTIAKDDGKIISSLYYSLKYPIPTAMLYHYKSQTRPKKWSIATIFGIGLPNPHFPGLIKFKNIYANLMILEKNTSLTTIILTFSSLRLILIYPCNMHLLLAPWVKNSLRKTHTSRWIFIYHQYISIYHDCWIIIPMDYNSQL